MSGNTWRAVSQVPAVCTFVICPKLNTISNPNSGWKQSGTAFPSRGAGAVKGTLDSWQLHGEKQSDKVLETLPVNAVKACLSPTPHPTYAPCLYCHPSWLACFCSQVPWSGCWSVVFHQMGHSSLPYIPRWTEAEWKTVGGNQDAVETPCLLTLPSICTCTRRPSLGRNQEKNPPSVDWQWAVSYLGPFSFGDS